MCGRPVQANIPVKKPASSTPQKPGVDEGSFQQLLQAAYVLQQHNERAQTGKPEQGYGRTLAGILEVQEQVRGQRLDFQAAASLVVRQLRELTNASGAAVGILDFDHEHAYGVDGNKNELNYCAASGSAAGEAGARFPTDSTLAAECLHTGLVVQCPRAESDARLSPELCHQLGVRALITSPINYQGKTVGVLELHFAEPESFAEHDVRTCQLMSSLMGDAITATKTETPASQPPDIKALPTDRAALLAALEKIKPQLERLAGGAGTLTPTERSADSSSPPTAPPPAKSATSPAPATTCEACGQALAQDELFCRSCGAARRGPNPWASLWEMQRAAEDSANGKHSAGAPQQPGDSETFDVYPSEVEDIVASLANGPRPPSKVAPIRPLQTSAPQTSPPQFPIDHVIPSLRAQSEEEATTPAPLTWTFPRPMDARRPGRDREVAPFGTDSLRSEIDREALYPGEEPPNVPEAAELQLPEESEPEELAPHSEAEPAGFEWLVEKWREHRAHIYVGLAGLMLLAVLTGLATPDEPASPAAITPTHKAKSRVPPQPELSFLDKMLINFGLAEAPAAATDPGNPKAQVWIDVHTALYYCAGSDLYQKTPDGRLTTQADAQQDQFQPAARKPCN